MAALWYLPGTLFLMFLIFCLVALVLVFWKADQFLTGRSSDRDGDEIEVEAAEITGIAEQTELKTPEITTEEIAHAHKKHTIEKTKTFRSMLKEPAEPEAEIIADATLELVFKYVEKDRYLWGFLENLQGLQVRSVPRINRFRFHLTLLPLKKLKFRTNYRSNKELGAKISFGLNGLAINNLRAATLRVRLCGRRLEYSVPIGKEICLGEIYVELSKYQHQLEAGEEIRTKYAILPKACFFPDKSKKT